MVNIIKQELEIDERVKKRIDFICNFNKTMPKYINGSLKQIEKTNLVYCEPHRVIIKGIIYLFFNNSDEIFIGNLSNKIKQNKISIQKSEYWEDRFFGFVDFIRIKLRNKYERKNYMNMTYELHNKDVIAK